MLLEWDTGALVGGVVDLTRAEKGEGALTMLGSAISPGSTAVIADVAEPAIEVVDRETAKLSGEVTRRPEDDVMAELEAAEEATEAAAKEARRRMREQRSAEVSEKFLLLEPVCGDRRSGVSRILGSQWGSVEDGARLLRTPAHAHVRGVGEGPGGTGPIGPSQLAPHSIDLGLASHDRGDRACGVDR